jgi:hypothetical protein
MEYLTVSTPPETWIVWLDCGIRSNRLSWRTLLSHADAQKDSVLRNVVPV